MLYSTATDFVQNVFDPSSPPSAAGRGRGSLGAFRPKPLFAQNLSQRGIKAFFTLISLAFILLSACESDNPQHQAEQKMHEAIMTVHDEVMPKMGEINRLGRELKKVADAKSSYDENTKATASQSVQQLQKADDAMMGWMEAYKSPSKMRDELQHEQIMAYLEKEKSKIDMVKTLMLESIQAGNEVLASLPKTE